eukprot:3382695-Pleurochrysis_carterae.AAC.2
MAWPLSTPASLSPSPPACQSAYFFQVSAPNPRRRSPAARIPETSRFLRQAPVADSPAAATFAQAELRNALRLTTLYSPASRENDTAFPLRHVHHSIVFPLHLRPARDEILDTPPPSML